MITEAVIDSHVSERNALLAVNAILAHTTKRRQELEEKDLLPPKEDFVWLVVATKKIPRSTKIKPIRIPLAHPLLDPRETSICLFTKDPQRKYKDLLAEKKINFVSRVVGIEKLRGKHKPFEARRQLLKDHGIFLTDDRIVPLLPKLLGKMFFDAKKQPVPVRLSKPDLKAELAKAVSATYMHQNAGTVVSIKLASVSNTPEQALSNLRSALAPVIQHIEGGWDNVLSLSIKTSNSMSLPIWSCDLEDRFSVPSLDAAQEEGRAIAKAKKEEREEKKASGKKRKVDAASAVENKVDEEPKKKKKKMDSRDHVDDEDESDFQGFGGHENDPTDNEEDSPPAPPSSKPRKSSKTRPADPIDDEFAPLPLVTPSAQPKRKQKSAVVASQPASDDIEPTERSESAKVLKVTVSKTEKSSKKGPSVAALQKKIKKGTKPGVKPHAKAKILGNGKLDD